MSKSTDGGMPFGLIGGVVMILVVFAGMFWLMDHDASGLNDYIEAHKWVVGETREGVTLVHVDDNWWRSEATFECEGQEYVLKSSSTRAFPSGLVVTLLHSYSGYITAEVS